MCKFKKNLIRFMSLAVALLALAAQVEQAQGYTLKRVHIEGNQAFSDGQIKKLMRSKGSSWYKEHPFVKRNLQLDLANIEAFYHKNGFLDCDVTAEEIPPEDSDKLSLRLHIREGSRTSVERVLLSGNEKMSSRQLRRALYTREGQPLDLSLLNLDARSIAERYGDVGHPYAQVTGEVEREGTEAQVKFHIQEGPPVYLGRTRYVGLRKVKAFVVRRELTFRPGDLYNRSAILGSQQRIYSTGLFSYVNVQLESAFGDSLHPDVAITLQERPMRWMGLKTDMGQHEEYDMTSDLTAEWGHKNLFATGRKLSLRAIATFRVFTEWENLNNRFELAYTEPWFLGDRMPATMSLYYEPGISSIGRGYRIQRFGGEFRLSRELGWFSRAWLTLKYERVDIFDLEPEVAKIMREAAGERIRRNVALSWERDTRDHVFEPTRGSLTQIFTEFVGGPLGGDDHYVKSVASWNRYQVLLKRAVLASRIKLGWAEEHGQGIQVPPDVRFYAGGANTVRGFAERSLGMLDLTGNPLGGEGLLLFNLELRRLLWWRLGGSLFFDMGNVWSRPRKATFDQLRSSAGLEVWLSTPVGPIRLACGFPLKGNLEKTKGRGHLAILFAF
jgi:outer membrane protein insertion porin family